MSDNGPQFASEKFKTFTKQYRFDHIASSPCYVQSNGFIECMVQTIKMSMKKCLAMPQSNKLPSPAEMLNNRKFKALLPMHSLQTTHQRDAVHEQIIQQQVKQSAYHNKSAKTYLHCTLTASVCAARS